MTTTYWDNSLEDILNDDALMIAKEEFGLSDRDVSFLSNLWETEDPLNEYTLPALEGISTKMGITIDEFSIEVFSIIAVSIVAAAILLIATILAVVIKVYRKIRENFNKAKALTSIEGAKTDKETKIIDEVTETKPEGLKVKVKMIAGYAIVRKPKYESRISKPRLVPYPEKDYTKKYTLTSQLIDYYTNAVDFTETLGKDSADLLGVYENWFQDMADAVHDMLSDAENLLSNPMSVTKSKIDTRKLLVDVPGPKVKKLLDKSYTIMVDKKGTRNQEDINNLVSGTDLKPKDLNKLKEIGGHMNFTSFLDTTKVDGIELLWDGKDIDSKKTVDKLTESNKKILNAAIKGFDTLSSNMKTNSKNVSKFETELLNSITVLKALRSGSTVKNRVLKGAHDDVKKLYNNLSKSTLRKKEKKQLKVTISVLNSYKVMLKLSAGIVKLGIKETKTISSALIKPAKVAGFDVYNGEGTWQLTQRKISSMKKKMKDMDPKDPSTFSF